jgi:hypothetical protein
MSKINKDEAMEIFTHVKEECVKDPLYFTKLLLEAFGKNIIELVSRIAGYLILYYVMTTYLNIPYGVTVLVVLVLIMSYHSMISVFSKIKERISKKDGKNNRNSG